MRSHPSPCETERVFELPCRTLDVPELTLFTYPTRLASAWQPDILQITIPSYSLTSDPVKLTISNGKTDDRVFKYDSKLKKVYRRFAEPMSISEPYLFDGRQDTDRNIAHIIKNQMTGLVAARTLMQIEEPIAVLLPSSASEMAKQAYQILGFSTICTDRNVIGTLIDAPSGNHGAYNGYYGQLYMDVDFEGYIQNTPERVFLARKGDRSLLNEKEIETLLQDYGFKKVYYEDISVSEQWSISRNAKVVVGVHGAALCSLLFNRNALALVELFHPGYVTHTYRHMVCEVGGTWCGVTGQMESNLIEELDLRQKTRHFALSPTKIDPTSLRKALQHLEID